MSDPDNLNHNEHIFRRKFPLGYFFHFNPFRMRYTSNYDSSPPTCGQILFFIELFTFFHLARKSYLKIDSTGIMLYWHPDQIMKFNWNEVLRLERKKFINIFPYEALYIDHPLFLNDNKPIFLTEKTKKHFDQQKISIPLRFYQGWPGGELEEELKKYIPHILSE
ncbi:MAG: hypothetical protein JEZ00_09135 [Anaerolineaceae bacterium]|nr:hypothetical protein [Anaerolineaceae bacterium]